MDFLGKHPAFRGQVYQMFSWQRHELSLALKGGGRFWITTNHVGTESKPLLPVVGSVGDITVASGAAP